MKLRRLEQQFHLIILLVICIALREEYVRTWVLFREGVSVQATALEKGFHEGTIGSSHYVRYQFQVKETGEKLIGDGRIPKRIYDTLAVPLVIDSLAPVPPGGTKQVEIMYARSDPSMNEPVVAPKFARLFIFLLPAGLVFVFVIARKRWRQQPLKIHLPPKR